MLVDSSAGKRCGARLRGKGTNARPGGFCRRWPVPGKARCKYHGGCSTGPRTVEGKARSLEAAKRGYKQWVAATRARIERGEIAKFPSGGKPGNRHRANAKLAQEREQLREQLDVAEAQLRGHEPPKHRRPGRPTEEARARMAELERVHEEHGLPTRHVGRPTTDEAAMYDALRLAELVAPKPPNPFVERLVDLVEEAKRNPALQVPGPDDDECDWQGDDVRVRSV